MWDERFVHALNATATHPPEKADQEEAEDDWGRVNVSAVWWEDGTMWALLTNCNTNANTSPGAEIITAVVAISETTESVRTPRQKTVADARTNRSNSLWLQLLGRVQRQQ